MTNPPTLLPPNATALERRLAQANAPISDIPTPHRDLWNPDTCPVNLLPWLAQTFGVEQWEEDWPEAMRRDAIKRSIYLHRHRGTIGAVRQALSALGVGADVQEWFNRTPRGAPYTFRLLLTVGQVGIPQTALAQVLRAVDTNKNLRSHLETVELTVSSPAGITSAAATMLGAEVEVGHDADGLPYYTTGHAAWDLVFDALEHSEDETVDALDTLDNILRAKMPASSWAQP